MADVLTNITGQTGMAIIRAIVAGERDPAVLAGFRNVRCKSSVATIQAALSGNYRPEHVFALQQALELHDVYQDKIRSCDAMIEQVLTGLAEDRPEPDEPLPPTRGKNKRGQGFDLRAALYALVGVDLTQVDGLGADSVLQLIAECGDDMNSSKLPSPGREFLRKLNPTKLRPNFDQTSPATLTAVRRVRVQAAAIHICIPAAPWYARAI